MNMMQHMRVNLLPLHIIMDVRNQTISVTRTVLATLRHYQWQVGHTSTSVWLCLETLRSQYVCLGSLVQRNRLKLQAAIRSLETVLDTVKQARLNNDKSATQVRVQGRTAKAARIQGKELEQVGGTRIVINRHKVGRNQPGHLHRATPGTVSIEHQLAESFFANEMREDVQFHTTAISWNPNLPSKPCLPFPQL